jgi:hypothetical protein
MKGNIYKLIKQHASGELFLGFEFLPIFLIIACWWQNCQTGWSIKY